MAGHDPIYIAKYEVANALTHAVGVLLAVLGLVALVVTASIHGTARDIVSVCIYGFTLVALYASSTIYHSVRALPTKRVCRIIDHASIYLLIAGSYTPFALISLKGPVGWTVFAGTWALAIAGVVLKLFFTGHFGFLSSFIYLAMGWMSMAFLNPLIHSVAPQGIQLLVAGGVVYTIGIIFYAWRTLPYAHAIWHLFVMAGSACHFCAIMFYVVPRG